MDKKTLRKQLIQKRKNLSLSQVNNCSKKIVASILNHPSYLNNQVIYLYYPILNEINLISLIEIAWLNNKLVALPFIDPQNETSFKLVKSFNDLELGPYQIKQPKESNQTITQKGLMIIPLVGYFKNYRLGYGKGYYDRYLAKHQVYTIGVGYRFSEIKTDVFNHFDCTLDEIIVCD